MHSKEMCREAKIHTCMPFTLVHLVPQPWWYSALRSQSCRSASADVWANGKERDFDESSAKQSSMAEALHGFQHDGICAHLLCIVSAYPVTQSPQKDSVLGVRGSSLPLLWTFSTSISLCDQNGFYDLFAPFAKDVLTQSLHLSQLGSVGTSVLSFFPSHSIALQWDKWSFHSIFTEGTPFFLLPDSPHCLPDIPKLGDTCGTSRASWVPSTLPQPQQPHPPASAELSRALGGLPRSSYPAKSNVLPDQGVQILVAAVPQTNVRYVKEATQTGHCHCQLNTEKLTEW